MFFDAIERGDAGTVWQRVQRGIRFDQIDESTELTPLALAAEAGHAEIVRILLSAGASPDLGGATTPLEAAVVGGHHEVVEALLRHNADVNNAVEEGFTPLMTAATTGDLVLVQMLLRAGARSRAKNDDGDTAITLAEDAGHFGVATVLRTRRPKKARVSDNDNGNRGDGTAPPTLTPKSPKTTNSELAAIVRETRLRAASQPETEGSAADEITPPVAAKTKRETKDQAQTPPDTTPAKPAPNAPAEDTHEVPAKGGAGRSAKVGSAASFKSSAEAEPSPPPPSALIDPEEEIGAVKIGAAELRGTLDRLCALWAQSASQAEKALRDGNPSPQLTDDQGFTLLMAAAHAGEPEIVRLLLAAGADAAQCDTTDDGLCALIWAIRSPSERRIEVIKTLAEAGVDPDQRCGLNDRTPLMFAAHADVYLDRPEGPSFANTTRTLVELGADIDAKDRRGLTVWRLIKRDALGAPTFGSSRRRLHHMVRVLEHCGAQPIESHAV